MFASHKDVQGHLFYILVSQYNQKLLVQGWKYKDGKEVYRYKENHFNLTLDSIPEYLQELNIDANLKGVNTESGLLLTSEGIKKLIDEGNVIFGLDRKD